MMPLQNMTCCKHFPMFFTFVSFVIFILCCSAEKTRIISPEQPVVDYFNPHYFSFVNITSRRYTRNNPIYYVRVHFNAVLGFGNNYTISFYIYEYRNGKYMRSFIEMHTKFCDFIHTDKLFGAPMRQGKLDQPCPYPRGDYHLYNMTFQNEFIPRGFPITKGQIWCNVTMMRNTLLSVHSNMEIRELDLKKKGKKSFQSVV